MLSAGTVITHHLSTAHARPDHGARIALAIEYALVWPERRGLGSGLLVTAWGLTLATALIAWRLGPLRCSWHTGPICPHILGQGHLRVAQGHQWFRGGAATLRSIAITVVGTEGRLHRDGARSRPCRRRTARTSGAWIKDGRLPPGSPPGRSVRPRLFSASSTFPSTVFILSPSGRRGRSSIMGLHLDWPVYAGQPSSGLATRLGRTVGRHQMEAHQPAFWAIRRSSHRPCRRNSGRPGRLPTDFPDPFLYGSDARSVTPELLADERVVLSPVWYWQQHRHRPLHWTDLCLIRTCRTTASSSAGFPIYNLYLAKPGAPIDACLSDSPSLRPVGFHLPDSRRAHGIRAAASSAFTSHLPIPPRVAASRTASPAFYVEDWKNSIRLKWLIKVFQSDNYCHLQAQPTAPRIPDRAISNKPPTVAR